MKVFIFLIIFSGVADAKGYKCKDSNGRTTYQQSPCRSSEAVEGYKFRQDSEKTKAELARVREEKEDKETAIIEARKKYESSQAYKTAVINDRAARINAQTQSRREISDSMNDLQRMIDRDTKKINRIYGIR